jgi:hypothetical protein
MVIVPVRLPPGAACSEGLQPPINRANITPKTITRFFKQIIFPNLLKNNIGH